MDFSTIINLLNELQAKIAELQASLADADAFARAQYDAGYAKGLEDGKAQGGGDVQAQIDAAVAAAVEPLQAQIVELQAQIDAIPAKVQEGVKAENDRVMALINEADGVVSQSLDKLVEAVKEAAQDLKNKIQL